MMKAFERFCSPKNNQFGLKVRSENPFFIREQVPPSRKVSIGQKG
jgi:hypothetical protein